MSSIPPAGHASLIQAHGAQNRADETRRKQNADEAQRTRTDTFADRLQEVIENDDQDTQVYADAEGAGSRGKSHEEEPSAENEFAGEADAEQNEASGGGLDIEA
ncbi:MAG: hypothetical protein D6744_07305 [Planctomycetota bacterium]|nr:MAG: hypothetical protein D6744_07305 [Planctomycetota bacterium]